MARCGERRTVQQATLLEPVASALPLVSVEPPIVTQDLMRDLTVGDVEPMGLAPVDTLEDKGHDVTVASVLSETRAGLPEPLDGIVAAAQ